MEQFRLSKDTLEIALPDKGREAVVVFILLEKVFKIGPHERLIISNRSEANLFRKVFTYVCRESFQFAPLQISRLYVGHCPGQSQVIHEQFRRILTPFVSEFQLLVEHIDFQ